MTVHRTKTKRKLGSTRKSEVSTRAVLLVLVSAAAGLAVCHYPLASVPITIGATTFMVVDRLTRS